MKKLVVIFSLVAFNLNAQVSTPKCSSYTENKKLGQVIFNTVNNYRKSLNESPFLWSEYWYESSLKWNNHLAKNAQWGHRNGPEWLWTNGNELIVGMTIPNLDAIDESMYQYIADSCLQQWIHSPMHHAGLKAPIRTIKQTSCLQDNDGDGKNEPFSVELCKYGAISVNINRYSNIKGYSDFTIVQCIMHLGFGIDNTNYIKSL